METIEAFRISMGNFRPDRSLEEIHNKEVRYKEEVKRLLIPLKIANRLHFSRDPDALENLDWLIVKIESSGQRSLLDEFDPTWSEDTELSRECAATLDLAQVALRVFRNLMSKSRMSPHDFYKLLAESDQHKCVMPTIQLANDFGGGTITLRSPEGQDDFAKTYPIPNLFTSGDIEEGSFSVDMVGKTSAWVMPAKGTLRSLKKEEN